MDSDKDVSEIFLDKDVSENSTQKNKSSTSAGKTWLFLASRDIFRPFGDRKIN